MDDVRGTASSSCVSTTVIYFAVSNYKLVSRCCCEKHCVQIVSFTFVSFMKTTLEYIVQLDNGTWIYCAKIHLLELQHFCSILLCLHAGFLASSNGTYCFN